MLLLMRKYKHYAIVLLATEACYTIKENDNKEKSFCQEKLPFCQCKLQFYWHKLREVCFVPAFSCPCKKGKGHTK